MATNITVQGPPSSYVPYIITDAVRRYMQQRNSIASVVEVDYWDRGLRMTNLEWRLHGQQSELASMERQEHFQTAVVDFLNESHPTTNIASALIFDQELSGAGGGDGDLLENTLAVKAVVFGQAALYTRGNFAPSLLSAFDENPDKFLSRLAGERDNYGISDALEVFAAEAPAASVVGTTSPTRSPVVMINALGPEQAQPNTRFMAFAVLIVVYFLSLAVGFALYKRNQRRTLQVKKAVEPPPETALSPV
jgi:hypothetical protein